jgi:hypothetical protein
VETPVLPTTHKAVRSLAEVMLARISWLQAGEDTLMALSKALPFKVNVAV